MTGLSFYHTTPPAPSDQEFSNWLNMSGIRWANLNAGERHTLKNMFIKKRLEDYETRYKKARPYLRKHDYIGEPKLLAPSKAISNQLHQRIVNTINEVKTPSTRTFLNVSAPKLSGSQPYIILQGSTVMIVDARNWDANNQYSLSKEMRVLSNNQYFEKGSVSLPFHIKSWKDFLPKEFNVLGMVVLCYGQAKFTKNPDGKTPFIVTDIEGLKRVMKQTIKQDEYSDQLSLYASTLLMRHI